jgi:hypothetical protein
MRALAAARFGRYLGRALPAAVLLGGALLLSCRGKAATPGSEAGQPAEDQWLVLQEGKLEPAGALPPPGATRRLPWTVQSRVAGLALREGAIYLAVNGYGIVRLELDSPPRLEPWYDPLLFRYRTIGEILPQAEGILCHLYFNTSLNIARAADLKVQGISLLRLSPPEGIYQVIPLPFQVDQPDWEAVGFLAEGGRRFLLEWKLSTRQETRFEYTAFEPGTGREQMADRAEYLRAYRFTGIADRSLSPALRSVLQAARGALIPAAGGAAPPTAIHFLLRREDSADVARYEYQPEGFRTSAQAELLTVHLYQAGEHLYALLPDGRLLVQRRQELPGRVRTHPLPVLPHGYRYEHVLVHGGKLVASWEERNFFEVGAAGILVRDFSP